MMVHDPSSHEACEAMDMTALYNQLDEELSLTPIPDPKDRGHPHAHFGHLLAGYDAGYYSYLRYFYVASYFAVQCSHD